MNRLKQYLPALFLLLAPVCLFAQTPGDPEPADLGNEVIGVISVAELTLGDVDKTPQEPQAIDSVIPMPAVEYDVIERQIQTDFRPEVIKAASLTVVEKLPPLYHGYVKAGIGTNTMPLLDAYYNSVRSKETSWGLRYKHLSSSGGVNDAAKSAFSDNRFHIYGKTFRMPDHTFKADIDYNRNVVHFYGVTPEDTVPEADDIKQIYNRIGTQIDFQSHYEDSTDINYGGLFSYYNLSDNYAAKENHVVLGGYAMKYINKELLTINGELDFNSYQSSILTSLVPGVATPTSAEAVNNSIIRINPQITTIGDKYRVSVGLILATDIGHTAKFHFYPKAEARYSLFNDILIPYAGIRGDLKRNSLNTLSQENPFMLTNGALQNTNNRFEFYGGIRGTLSSKTSFNIRVSQSKHEAQAFFVQDTTFGLWNQFAVIYDELDLLQVTAEVTYHQTEKIKLSIKGDIFNYKTDVESEAWNMPDYRFGLRGIYDLSDKILVRGDIYVVGTRMARSVDFVEGVAPDANGFYPVKLNGYVDANIGFEYRYTSRLSAFLNFTNVASQNYQRWYNYKTQGLNVLGGVTYSF